MPQTMGVAAVEGRPQTPATPPAKEIDRWIAAFDEHEKAALLARVVRGEKGVGAQLRRRFRRHVSPRETARTMRTAGALRARAEELARQRREVISACEAKVLVKIQPRSGANHGTRDVSDSN